MISPTLVHDGWEHHTAYHYIAGIAPTEGRFCMVLADVKHDGVVQMYTRTYDDGLWSLIDARPRVRAMGFAAFAKAAHRVALERLNSATEQE